MSSAQHINRSRRILSGRGEDESISRARAVMTAFERVWNGTRQIRDNHPRLKQALQLFFDQLKTYTDEFGELSLDVGSYALTIDGQSILKVERKTDNFINALFHDDIRRLILHPELTEAELLRFIGILRTDFAAPQFSEDDLVTLLWHEGFQGISYSVFDAMEEDAPDDESDTANQAMPSHTASPDDECDASCNRMLVHADEVMAYAMAQRPAANTSTAIAELAGHPIVVSAGDKLLRDLTPGLSAGASESLEPIETLPAEQLKILRDRLQISSTFVAPKFGDILLQTLQNVSTHDQASVLAGLGTFMHSNLVLGTETCLVHVLETMAALGRTPEGASAYAHVLTAMQSAEVMDALIARLEAPEHAPEVLRLIQTVGNDLFPALWERLLTLTNTASRQHLLAVLTPCAFEHLSFLTEQIAQGNKEVAMQALATLKGAPMTAVARGLLSGLRHPSPVVRLEVANLIRQSDDPNVHQTLLSMVHDTEEQVRQAVVQILVDADTTGVEDALVATLHRVDFARRSAEEKRRTLSSLGRVATSHGLSLLRDIALGAPTSPIKGDQEAQIAAIRALASRADGQALPGLQKLASKWFGNKEVKKAARFAVTVIARQGETA